MTSAKTNIELLTLLTQTMSMKTLLLILCIGSSQLNAQNYFMLDSLKADSFFKQSFQFYLFSQEHQRYLDTALIYDHTNAYYWQQKSMPLSKMKKYELALSYLDSAVKYDKTLHWREYRAFIKCIFQKNYGEAIQDFQYVKQKNENGNVMDHSFNFYIGLSYLQLNQFDSAEKYMHKSIDFWERSWKMGHYLEYMYLGIVYLEKNQFDRAHQYLDSAIRYYPQFSDAKYYKAMIYRKLKAREPFDRWMNEAKLDLEKGFTINEDNAIYEEYPYQIKKYWFPKK